MLAGTIQSPSRWDPAKNLDKSTERWNFVLDGMVAQGWLPAADRAQEQFPKFLPEPPQAAGIPGDAGGHVYNLARAELESRGISEQEINTEGLTIDLTIDSKRQEQAVAAVDEGAQGPAGQPAQRAGLRRPEDRARSWPTTAARTASASTTPRPCASPARRSSRSYSRPRCRTAARTSGWAASTTARRRRTSSASRSATPRASAATPATVQHGDDQVGQHRLLQDGHRHRPAERGRRRAPGRHPGRRAARTRRPASRWATRRSARSTWPSAFATFAADGIAATPYVVAKVTAADGRVIYDRGTDDRPAGRRRSRWRATSPSR